MKFRRERSLLILLRNFKVLFAPQFSSYIIAGIIFLEYFGLQWFSSRRKILRKFLVTHTLAQRLSEGFRWVRCRSNRAIICAIGR